MAKALTAAQLLEYDGSDSGKPVYIAVKGTVYDVSAAREFYGKGGPYEAFAGRECARALAIMKVDMAECNDNLSDCTEKQLKTLDDWIAKFNTKYSVVGKLLPEGSKEALEADLALLRPSPFPPSFIATLVVVLFLTLLGGYVLFLDMQGPVPPNAHSEL
ncbi:hypothetical protein GPECTOR_22g908 [Gonium pectorale]|uniref:Cytochrome b5 heme-binding domain-containing protein n=1 Tax=Gonium pectorale TaxID=33097 RepID=A0A150GHL6_GONPE|nr:hypothetical protein GPECTOR_22g908 [Gonium pectorale]|eukprot:KXZ49314.1 hypothetical protein GPECTOR_22g908 [Gonium pectorale]